MSNPLLARRQVRPLLSCLGVLLVAGCSGGDDLPALAAARSAPTATTLLEQAVASVELAPERTAQQINDANPMGWAGRAHNQYLVAFKTALKLSPATRCEVLDRVLRDGRFLGADTLRFSRQAREQWAPPSVARVGCILRSAAFDGAGATAFVRPVASAAMMSGDVTPYFSAMEAAYDQATTAAGYAALVDAIVASAELVLTGDELIAVQTGASIAISSADYWEANIVSDYYEIEYLYETCQYVATEPYQCGNDVSLPGGRPFGATPRFVRASYKGASAAASCSGLLDWKGVAKIDGTAGFGALALTLNPGAGVAAGGTASATGFLGQGLSFFLCVAAS